MATKKTTATAKKAATKTAKKTAKKVTKKVAAKKVTKKVAKKATKKAKNAPTTEELQQAAYLNYVERIKSGISGSPELDWAKAKQDLA